MADKFEKALTEMVAGTKGNFGRNELSANQIERLCAALHPRIVELWMNNCTLCPNEDLVNVVESFKRTVPPESLSDDARNVLNSFAATSDGIAKIANSLPKCAALEVLVLSCNNIKDPDVALIAKSLTHCTLLKQLILFSNRIGDSGTISISDSLRRCTALTRLHLSLNLIGNSGATALASSLRDCTALEGLYLSDNRIGDSGIIALADCMKKCPLLEEFIVSNNEFGDDGALALADFISFCPKLTKLDLAGNEYVSASAKAAVSAAFPAAAHVHHRSPTPKAATARLRGCVVA